MTQTAGADSGLICKFFVILDDITPMVHTLKSSAVKYIPWIALERTGLQEAVNRQNEKKNICETPRQLHYVKAECPPKHGEASSTSKNAPSDTLNGPKVTVCELIKPIVAGYQLDTTRSLFWD